MRQVRRWIWYYKFVRFSEGKELAQVIKQYIEREQGVPVNGLVFL